MPETPIDQTRLIEALRDPRRHGAACTGVRLIETHISYVLLTGEYAYKIKKCVALGFVDFSTLEARRRCCHEELRLNRRLAPALYLDVVAITGDAQNPVLGGEGPACEYAVRMREFPQDALLCGELERGQLTAGEIDTLAAIVAQFHGVVAVAPPDGPFGTPEDILGYARANFAATETLAGADDRATLALLRAWTEREFAARRDAFELRRRAGFVRECHGDLHLGNIARIDGKITIFDCIEFNEHLRWIDVLSEVAFTTMDLEDRGRRDLAQRFLDRYLALTGDYEGLAVYRLYAVYRALVRAKVACLRLVQVADGAQRAPLQREFRGYLALAQRLASPARPALVITHGLSGSGKTAVTQQLLEDIGAIRIRTDVERKRTHGPATAAPGGTPLASGLYAPDITRATYARACDLARKVVAAGFCAIIDGTFQKRWQRDAARALAASLDVRLVIIAFRAADATLRRRIAQRAAEGTDASDADLAVLDLQIAGTEPLAADEAPDVVAFDAEVPLGNMRDSEAWRQVLARIGGTCAEP